MADRHTKIRGKQILADSVEPSDLQSTNAAADTLIPAYDVSTGKFTWVANASGGLTLDGAYDFGGAGAGRSITVDTGAVEFTGADAANHTFYINQTAVLASGKHSVYIRSSTNQTVDTALLYVQQANALSIGRVAVFSNLGTGHNVLVNQDEVLAGGKHALYVNSAVANVNADSALAYIAQSSASATEPAIEITMAGLLAYAQEINTDAYGISVVNTGTGTTAKFQSSGIQTSGKFVLSVSSSAALTNSNSPLAKFVISNASSTEPVIEISNSGSSWAQEVNTYGGGIYVTVQSGGGQAANFTNYSTEYGVIIHQAAACVGTRHGLYIISSVAQTNANSSLVWISQVSGSTEPAIEISNLGSGYAQEIATYGAGLYIYNLGTNNAFYINQFEVLATGNHGIYLYSNVAHVNGDSALVKVVQDHASSTQNCYQVQNDGVGSAVAIAQNGNAVYGGLYIGNAGTSHGAKIAQVGVLTSGNYALWVGGSAAQTVSANVYFAQDGATASAPNLQLSHSGTGDNIFVHTDGTGHSIYIQADGILATGKHGIYLYSNTAHVNADSDLIKVVQSHASATCNPLSIFNYGDAVNGAIYVYQSSTAHHHGIQLLQYGVLEAGYRAAIFTSQVAQTNSATSVLFVGQAAGSTQPMAEFQNSGTSYGLWMRQIGNGVGFYTINSGTKHAAHIQQDGVLVTANHGLYVNSTAAHIVGDAALVKFSQGSAAATEPALEVVSAATATNTTAVQITSAYWGQALWIQSKAGDPSGTPTNYTGVYMDNIGQGSTLWCTSNSYTLPANGAIIKASTVQPSTGGANFLSLHTHVNNTSYGFETRATSGGGFYWNQSGVLGAGRHAFYALGSQANTVADSALVKISQGNASATEPALEIVNAGTGAAIEVSDGDIRNVAWTEYGTISTIVGWSSRTLTEIKYKKVGNLVFVTYNISGTSNATNITFTLPYTNAANAVYSACGQVADNGLVQQINGFTNLPNGSATVTVFRDGIFTAFTASGVKNAYGQFWYEANT